MDKKDTDSKEIRVRLSTKLQEIFQEVKDHYMLENYSEVVRILIKEKYDQIQKEKQAAEF